MKTTLRLASAAAALCLSCASIRAQEAFKPAPEHVELVKAVGTWDAEVKMWMKGPDAPPETSRGVEEITALEGGLWVTSTFKGEVAGMPFQGRGISGYDPDKKKYVDVWIDSTDPHLTLLEGEYDKSTKTLTQFGKSTEPQSGKPYDIKTETVLKGEDERIFKFYMKSEQTGDDYFKLLEMTYRRKKG